MGEKNILESKNFNDYLQPESQSYISQMAYATEKKNTKQWTLLSGHKHFAQVFG